MQDFLKRPPVQYRVCNINCTVLTVQFTVFTVHSKAFPQSVCYISLSTSQARVPFRLHTEPVVCRHSTVQEDWARTRLGAVKRLSV